MHALIIIVAFALASGGDVAELAAQAQSLSVSAETKASVPEVYLYGNSIPGPYKVDLVGATVQINGIQVFPPLVDPGPPPPEPTPEVVERHAFSQQGWALRRQMEAEGKCCRELADALADFYRARTDLVAEVSGVTDHSFWVRWTDGTESETLISPSERSQTPEDKARGRWKLVQELLEKGCIIIISSSGGVTVPPNDAQRLEELRAEIARARRTPIDVFGTEATHYTDGRWEGKHLPADIAREFARPRKLSTQQED
ncbi:MAG: hypothetical protein OEX18_09835 [Candidatus Krumholzibacteria bacterium]|nr:hypothetical protein [Candidatus Krumholzibacteria bacterium]MDH4337558.1 hypothetical protein [Candidatus Krumholzibacteria bacterium]MDH5269915.1 hypothetical protein [Candidatus Krumholzibacteria bacterium]